MEEYQQCWHPVLWKATRGCALALGTLDRLASQAAPATDAQVPSEGGLWRSKEGKVLRLAWLSMQFFDYSSGSHHSRETLFYL